MKKTKIPTFKTLEEEAKFWDTHTAADFWDEMKPVKMKFVRPKSQGITVRFGEDTLSSIRHVANKKGVGPTTLIRMWIMERLQQA